MCRFRMRKAYSIIVKTQNVRKLNEEVGELILEMFLRMGPSFDLSLNNNILNTF